MSRRLFAVTAALTLSMVAPWAATSASAQALPARLDLSTAIPNAVVPPVIIAGDQLPSEFRGLTPKSRASSWLMGLYASTAVMQALDVHSSLTAFRAGAVEANPLMVGPTRNTMAFIALKAGVATGTVLAARNMAKTNKIAAIAALVAVNSAYAMIVNHNYQVARGRR
jgi:hypothetical protein